MDALLREYGTANGPIRQLLAVAQRSQYLAERQGDILRHVEVSRAEEDKDSICRIVGLEDMMYGEGMRKRVANKYRQCIYDLASCKKIDRAGRGGAEEMLVEDPDFDGSEREVFAWCWSKTQGIKSRKTCNRPTSRELCGRL